MRSAVVGRPASGRTISQCSPFRNLMWSRRSPRGIALGVKLTASAETGENDTQILCTYHSIGKVITAVSTCQEIPVTPFPQIRLVLEQSRIGGSVVGHDRLPQQCLEILGVAHCVVCSVIVQENMHLGGLGGDLFERR